MFVLWFDLVDLFCGCCYCAICVLLADFWFACLVCVCLSVVWWFVWVVGCVWGFACLVVLVFLLLFYALLCCWLV